MLCLFDGGLRAAIYTGVAFGAFISTVCLIYCYVFDYI
jgi:hypothetical protein